MSADVASFYGSLSDGSTVTASNGAIVDGDLVLDSLHDPMTASFGTGGTLRVSFNGSGTKFLGGGYKGVGSFSIAEGKTLSVYVCYLAFLDGSSGVGMVSGSRSALTCTELYVGRSGSGKLSVDAGASLGSSWCFIGLNSGTSGEVTVSGNGSTWTNSGKIVVGGGLQGLPDEPFTPATGKLTVDNGGLVTTGSLYASLSDLHGDGTIVATQGAVLDADVVLDRDHGNKATYSFGTGGTLNVTFNGGDMGVGYLGKGTLRIADGVKISSQYCSLGSFAGSQGVAVVTGAGSEWNCEGLDVNYGKLKIEAGALVGGDGSNYIINGSEAVVTGHASKWVNGVLDIGSPQWEDATPGRLTVADGAQITADRLELNNADSSLRLLVDRNDMVVIGGWRNSALYNHGQIKFYADPFVAAGTYTPITAAPGKTIYVGSGDYLSCGGVWDLNSRTFTVPQAITAKGGQWQTLTGGQRLIVTDEATGKRVGLSLLSSAASADFKATLASADELAILAQAPGFEGVVLSAWSFDAGLSGTETLLSFDIGLGATDPKVWHFENGMWTPYAPDLISYDSHGIISFTVTGFSDYAVTATPEPATMSLLLLGSLAMMRRRSN